MLQHYLFGHNGRAITGIGVSADTGSPSRHRLQAGTDSRCICLHRKAIAQSSDDGPRKLQNCCGTTVCLPMWNHFPNLLKNVEPFSPKYRNWFQYVEPFSQLIPNFMKNQVEPMWFHMWNHFLYPESDTTLYSQSIQCSMTFWVGIMVPQCGTKMWNHYPYPESDTTLYSHSLQCSMTFWAGKIVEPNCVATLCSITIMWNQIVWLYNVVSP